MPSFPQHIQFLLSVGYSHQFYVRITSFTYTPTVTMRATIGRLASQRLIKPVTPFTALPTTFASTRSSTPLKSQTPLSFAAPLFLPHLPAFKTWFLPDSTKLNTTYLLSSPVAAAARTPVEITTPQGTFTQSSLPWASLLGYLSSPQLDPQAPKLYLAQQPPHFSFAEDFPAPFGVLGLKERPEAANLKMDLRREEEKVLERVRARHPNVKFPTPVKTVRPLQVMHDIEDGSFEPPPVEEDTSPVDEKEIKQSSSESSPTTTITTTISSSSTDISHSPDKEPLQEKEKEKSHAIDIYSTSLWLSRQSQQSNTPLHRDPNDNLFLQLSGAKIIRLLPPQVGDALYRTLAVAGMLGKDIDARGRISDTLLDRSAGRDIIDLVIWEGLDVDQKGLEEMGELGRELKSVLEVVPGEMREVRVERGGGVYIPRGWWHSVRSVVLDGGEEGERKSSAEEGGVVGSVNWWFR